MAMTTIKGERSSRPVFHGGRRRRTGPSAGSVTCRRNITMGLRGSGVTHETKASAMTKREEISSSHATNTIKADTIPPCQSRSRLNNPAEIPVASDCHLLVLSMGAIVHVIPTCAENEPVRDEANSPCEETRDKANYGPQPDSLG